MIFEIHQLNKTFHFPIIFIFLSQPQQQHNITQPQHSCWAGHENDFKNPTHPPTHHPTTETQQQPL